MRIISGKYKGRIIVAPKNIPTRPTTDFAKSGLFNILRNNFDFSNISVLDLFAGTGSITFEFASRGCEDIIAVEQNPVCYKHIKNTIKLMELSGVEVWRDDVLRFIKKKQKKADIIFADPPFKLDIKKQLINTIFDKNILKENGWLILEQQSDHDVIKNDQFVDNRKYGNVSFSIYKN